MPRPIRPEGESAGPLTRRELSEVARRLVARNGGSYEATLYDLAGREPAELLRLRDET